MERLQNSLRKIKEEQLKVRKELKEKTIGYILAALSLVAGLAWNEAIKALIDQLFPNTGAGFLIKLLYAFAITIVIVVVTMYLLRLIESDKENKK